MKTGIAVCTTPAREIDEGLHRFCAPETILYVHNDVERMGPARARNRCIRNLYMAGCDFLFLLDDDVRLLFGGFEAYFIEHATRAGLDALGLPESFKSRPLSIDGEVVYWDACIGAFHFCTRRFVETVGYFNAAYSGYGWEDAAYKARAKRSGLAGAAPGFPSLLRAPSFFFSEDVYGRNPVPNYTPAEKREGIERNGPVAAEEYEGGRIFYPFA
jgi:hypothetical protein